MTIVEMITGEDRKRLEDSIKNAGFDIIDFQRHKLDQLFLYLRKRKEELKCK